MKNTGTSTWSSSDATPHRLGSQNPQDNAIWGLSRVNLPSNVLPGSEATFNFNATAPATAGTYDFQWRMVENGSSWFGDLTQNLAINVSTTAPPPPPPPTFGCADPAFNPWPSNYAKPCPVLNVVPASAIKPSGSFTVSITPQTTGSASDAIYVYKKIYIHDKTWNCPDRTGEWCILTLPGTADPQATDYLQKNTGTSFEIKLSDPQFAGISAGYHFIASWEWTWSAASQCYKGPDGACSATSENYRLQQFQVQ